MNSDLSVLTLNLWNINEPFRHRLAILNDFLKVESPDVICFQEVPVVNGEPVYPSALPSLGYRCIYLPSGNVGDREEGIAICARLDPALVAAIPLPTNDEDYPRTALAVRLCPKGGGGPVLVVTTHLSYRPTHVTTRRLQAEEIARMISRLWSSFGTLATIVAGDFNCTEDEDTLKFITSPVEGTILRDVQASFGEAARYTFAGHNPYVSTDLWPDRRIDYIFATNDLTSTSFRIVLDDVTEGGNLASDHFGLLAEFRAPHRPSDEEL